MNRQLENILNHFGGAGLGLVLMTAVVSCTQSSNSLFSDDETDLPLTATHYPNSDLSASLSSANSGLTPAENTALQNVANAMDEVNPAEDETLSAALTAEAERLIAAEKKGQDVTAQKMALAGKMLSECANQVATLSPLPGQTLVGIWQGNTCAVPANKKNSVAAANFKFEVAGDGMSGPYQVRGGFSGQMGARPDGSSVIQGTPWYGELADQPSVGTGVLYNKKFAPAAGGAFHSCEMGVSMKASRNLIPERYIEAMRRAGACYRRALVLMSPMMDSLFEDMDPALAQVLQAKMLGLN